MRLLDPRISTRHTHQVGIPIEDGPALVGDSSSGYPGYRFQPDILRIDYLDGELRSVRVSGTRVSAKGDLHARGDIAYIEYTARDGALREDTPDWVRQAVAEHPWPAA